jgi:hypothetical protein
MRFGNLFWFPKGHLQTTKMGPHFAKNHPQITKVYEKYTPESLYFWWKSPKSW